MRMRLAVIMIVSLLLAALPLGVGQAAPDQAGGGVHVVQWGENLATIAYRYGTTVQDLIRANGLMDPNMIYIGQQLLVPTAGGPATMGNFVMPTTNPAMMGNPALAAGNPAMMGNPALAAGNPAMMPGGNAGMMGGAAYTVRRGDTLTAIALRHGTSVNALMQANGLSSSIIVPGQQLMVPGAAMPAQAGGAMPFQSNMASNMALGRTYPVQAGDTLSAIAYRYGMAVNDLMQANGLYNPWIFPGQQLLIPGGMPQGFEQPAGTFYQIRPGDTLAGVALRYGTTLPSILQANNLSQAQLIYPGQQLVIPGMMQPAEAMRMLPASASGAPVMPQGIGPMLKPGGSPLGMPPNPQGQAFIAPVTPPGPQSTQPMLQKGGAPMIAPIVPGQGGPLAGSVPPAVPGEFAMGVVFDNDPLAAADKTNAPLITMKWEGHVVSQSFPEDFHYPAVLRVTVGGAKGMQVTVAKKGGASWSTTGFTGTKPEYGDGTVEFAPLNPGKHTITLDGQGASMIVDIKPNSLTYVDFTQVRASGGPIGS